MAEQGVLGVITLPGEPASVPRVRRFVRDRMAGHPDELVDTAEICVSELVTNAVLHAGTDVQVHLADLGDAVRLEVRDRSSVVPRQMVHTARASTGRGIEMVGLLARSWGCDTLEQDGTKTVWCELATASDEAPPSDPLAMWLDDDELIPPTGPAPDRGPVRHPSDPQDRVWQGPERRMHDRRGQQRHSPDRRGPEVDFFVLRDYPVRLGIRAREHDAAILRECLLLSQSAGRTDAPTRLVSLAQMITSSYGSDVDETEEMRVLAFTRGETMVDLRYPRVPDARTIVVAWLEIMAELDEYAAGTSLLALATPPDLLALRTWVVGEVVRQSDGATPQPWDGPLA